MKRSALCSAILLVAGTLSCAPQPSVSVCDVSRQAQSTDALIVVRGEGVFGRHGAILRDARCPEVRLVWREDSAFSESSEAEAFSAALWREEITQQRRFEVTVEGKLRAADGGMEIVVHRLVGYEFVDQH